MDDVQAEKHLSAHRAHPERTARMMAALSSRPIRALILVFIIFLIYCFQPFTAKGQIENHKTESSSSSSTVSWPHWPSRNEKATHDHPEEWSSETMTKSSEGGPRIRQATMIYDTDKFNAVYERSVDSHIRHGKLWNYPTHILRHDIVDAGFFNKPAFLLGLVIEEMAKPYGQRADWIV